MRVVKHSNLFSWTSPAGITWLQVSGWEGWASIRGGRDGRHVIALRRTPSTVSYTYVAGHPDVVRSLAETMLRGAARADGIEVQA